MEPGVAKYNLKEWVSSRFQFVISNWILGPLLSLVLIILLFLVLGTKSFFTTDNLSNILSLGAPLIIICMGETLVILIGGIDLSIEGIMSLSAIMVGFTLKNNRTPIDLGMGALFTGLIVGALCGLMNGFLHTRLKIPSLLTTLGLSFATLGLGVILCGGYPIPLGNKAVQSVATGRLLFVPTIFIIVFAVFAILLIVERYTVFGRYCASVGGDEILALQAGIKIDRVKILVFTVAGSLYGLAGFLNTARLSSADTRTSAGFLFRGITAAVVGGTALSGGIGGIFNAFVGALFVTVLADGLILRGVNIYLQSLVNGLVLISAVAITLDRKKIAIIK